MQAGLLGGTSRLGAILGAAVTGRSQPILDRPFASFLDGLSVEARLRKLKGYRASTSRKKACCQGFHERRR